MARLQSITVNPDLITGSPEAYVHFSYRGSADPNAGRIHSTTLIRRDASGIGVPVQRVEYKYYGDTDVPANTDLGSLGDLVLVIHSERIDPAPGDSATTWRQVFTHYRYHRAGASPDSGESVTFTGFNHQLKMVVSPEQVEYAAVQGVAAMSGSGPVSVESWVSNLLSATDEQALWTSGESPYTLSSKVFEQYEVGSSTGKVLLVRTNAGCGCSGGTGLRTFAYTYVVANSTRSTTFVDETPDATSTSRRRHWYETYAPGGVGIQHLRARAIQELDVSGSSVSSTRRGWVTAFEHDPVGRRLTRKRNPSTFPQGIALPSDAVSATSSFDYRPGTPSDAPVFDTGPTVGLTERFDYADSTAVAAEPYLFNQLIASYAGEGANPSGSAWDLIQTTTYGDADGSSSVWTPSNSRPWLPSVMQRYRTDSASPGADDIEESRFFYGFISGNQIAWSTSAVEADLESENGPSTGSLWYSSHTLYDTRGRAIWTIDADGAATNYSYVAPSGDFAAPTGLPTAVTANASTSGLASSYYGLSTTAFAPHSADGSLTTTFKRDLSGRVQATTLPGGVTHYVIRTMAEHPFRPRVPHYVEYVLPHQWPGTPGSGGIAPWVHDGPATLTWYTASNAPLSTSEFSVASTDYKFAARGSGWQVVIGEFALVEETGRTYTNYLHNGAIDWSAYWTAFVTGTNEAPFDGIHYSQYQYDELGRIKRFAAANGTVTTYDYDVLDRLVAVGVGVIDDTTLTFYSDSSGYTYTPTAEYVYDEDGGLDIGNGYLSTQRSFAESATRTTKFFHDWRDRLVFTLNPAVPHTFNVYDNLDRIVDTGLLTGTPTGTSSSNHQNISPLGSSDASLRTTLTRTDFSQRGLAYRQRTAIDPSLAESSLTFLDSHRWFDEEARLVGRWSGTGPMVKFSRDGLGRFTTIYTSDHGSDPAPGAASNYDDVFNRTTRKADLTGDVVLEETTNLFDAPSGVPNMVITRRRSHDAPTSATGELDLSGNLQYAVTTFAGSILDGANRPIKGIDYGTNLSTDVLQANGTTPDLTDPLAGFERVTETFYDDLGHVDSTVGPTGTVTKFVYDAADRTIATIENYSSASPVVLDWNDVDGIFAVSSGVTAATPDVNRVTTTTYNGIGAPIATATFNAPDGATTTSQITRYHYGVRIATSSGAEASLVDSNDLLSFVEYPGTGSGFGGMGGGGGSGSQGHYEAIAYNEQGESRYTEEGAGSGPSWYDSGSSYSSKHEFLRDAVGRVIVDHVLAVGTDIDTTIDALVYAYDVPGRRIRATSYDGFTSVSSPGTAVNDVETYHDSLWHLTKIDQNPVGALTYSGSTPSGNTRRVEYTYDTQHSGSSTPNYSRLSQLTYPDGSALTYQYGLSSSTPDRRISRPTSLTLGSTRIALYERIGLSVPAVVDLPVPDIQLDRYRSEAGATSTAVYPGMDRFGRVKRQMWVDGNFTTGSGGYSNIPPLVETLHTYNAADNRLTSIDDRPGAGQPLSQEYAYDGLHRLKEAKRGVAASGSVPVGKNSQRWSDGSGNLTLDVLGNWRETWTDGDGDGVYGTSGIANLMEVDRREHDDLNRSSSRELANVSGTPTTLSLADPTYDLASNLKSQDVQVPGHTTTTSLTYKHDAWNRLLEVSFGGTPRAKYHYNALHQRVVKMSDMLGSGTGPTAGPNGTIDQVRLMYYDRDWRLLEERIDESAASGVISGTWASLTLDRHQQYVWGLRGIDDIILHRIDRNRNGSYADSSDGTWYHLTDVQGSTVCLTDSSANVVERVTYSAYGVARHHWGYDVDGDGDVDTTGDRAIINSIMGLALANRSIGGSDYRSEADLNRDGVINSSDRALITSTVTARPDGQISDVSSTGSDNIVGWDGYLFNSDTALYTVRFRHYDPALGRWMERDPAGYAGDFNLFAYCGGSPIDLEDPLGLVPKNLDDWEIVRPTHGLTGIRKDLEPWAKSAEEFKKRLEARMAKECDRARQAFLQSLIDKVDQGMKEVENAIIDVDQAQRDLVVAVVSVPLGFGGIILVVAQQTGEAIVDGNQGQDRQADARIIGTAIGLGIGGGLSYLSAGASTGARTLAATEGTAATGAAKLGAEAAEAATGKALASTGKGLPTACCAASVEGKLTGRAAVMQRITLEQLAGRLSTEEMAQLQRTHGVEFAQVYLTGRGPNGGGGAYYLIRGTPGTVQVPIGPNVRFINHTHPTVLNGKLVGLNPSKDDLNVVRLLQSFGCPQRTFQIVPEASPPFTFTAQ